MKYSLSQSFKSLFENGELVLSNKYPQAILIFSYFIKSGFGFVALATITSLKCDITHAQILDTYINVLKCAPNVQQIKLDVCMKQTGKHGKAVSQ